MKMNEAQAFFDKVQADRAAKQLHQDPAYTLDQINSTLSLLKSETDAIFAGVKAPVVVEPPKEEAKDAEMKNEEKKDEN